ncbi:MAG: hypothetical protein IPO07_13765 [Haliscomenobacter sp.]|nr:hypothetical protein [Haliscomenobacter sp.]
MLYRGFFHPMSAIHTLVFMLVGLVAFAQNKPLVNQAGYNLGEAKRFVCVGAKDGTKFKILNTTSKQVEFEGEILNQEGWFSTFNPIAKNEFYIDVTGHGQSVPFWIADHLMEKISAKLAYDFFIDVRGSADASIADLSKIYGGGPSRDGGAYGLETIFECLYYASNPALFDRWKTELGDNNVPDLIDLILWHAEFAYTHVAYQGPVASRHGSLGYEGQPRMQYDYWNHLDQLSVICAAYHDFLKPYLPREKYLLYRKVCNEKWLEYERHKVVRYWTYSTKWVDIGFQEFNEMGNAYGQSVFRNLFMYYCEKNEPQGNPGKYLKWAQESAQDIIQNWDFNNPRHMWWIRNAEHITPQALAYFLLLAPEQAPKGTREKLSAWAIHMQQKTNNFWKYRVHSETEWAHAKTKELGGAPALGGSLFAVAHLLKNPRLRDIGWAQVDFVFGVNPVGAHLSNKSQDRLDIGGYWAGVENGWPGAHPNGYGQLGKVRGTLDGSPLDKDFQKKANEAAGQEPQDQIGKDAYATEGWCVSNRGWMATLTFSTLGSQQVKILNARGVVLTQAKVGETVTIELKAALNLDWDQVEKGKVWVKVDQKPAIALEVTETGENTGIFRANYKVPSTGRSLQVSYGSFGFAQNASINIKP